MMEPSEQKSGDAAPKPGWHRSPPVVAACVVLAGVGLALAFEHRVHLMASLPLLLPLGICLAMHVFMHRGHGGGGR